MLPIIDLSSLSTASAAERLALAQRLGETCEKVGFLYVVGHGVSEQTIKRAKAAQEGFFALAEEEKRRLTRPEGIYRGYLPQIAFGKNRSGAPHPLYEGFVLGEDPAPSDPEVAATKGLYGPNLWPQEPSGFRAAMSDYWQAVDRLSKQLIGLFSLALGQSKETLTRHFDKQLTNISLLHYFKRPVEEAVPKDDLAPHRDTNVITVLLPSPIGGLEVERQDGSYAAVDPLPGAFVINVGNMLECWSGGRFRSTFHRVHPPRGQERFSIGFFAVPSFGTVVEPLPGLPIAGKPDDMKPRHAGHDLAGFVANFDRLMKEQSASAY